MAISVDWSTRIISIPQADLTPLGGGIYELDLDQLRLDLKALEAGEEGVPFDDTHLHVTEITLSGATYSRFFVFINGYTVTFEDGQYAVNATGANCNIADVMNVNQVSLRTFNSAGLITVVSGSGLTQEQHDQLMATSIEDGGRLETVDDNILAVLSDTGFLVDVEGGKWEISGNDMIFYKADNVTEVMRFTITRDGDGNPIVRIRQ